MAELRGGHTRYLEIRRSEERVHLHRGLLLSPELPTCAQASTARSGSFESDTPTCG